MARMRRVVNGVHQRTGLAIITSTAHTVIPTNPFGQLSATARDLLYGGCSRRRQQFIIRTFVAWVGFTLRFYALETKLVSASKQPCKIFRMTYARISRMSEDARSCPSRGP